VSSFFEEDLLPEELPEEREVPVLLAAKAL
jgi:hypothetical protein